MQSFQANGKLLISGEYLVLQGALALAVPCRYGQKMIVEENSNAPIHWKSVLMNGNIWMEELIDVQSLSLKIKTSDSTLVKILKSVVEQKPGFQNILAHKKVTTHLEFPPEWGLGSSSTIIHLVAQWSGADPMLINKQIFSGSGYDIACAGAQRPILFKIDEEGTVWDTVHFIPPSPEKIFFIHLNQKKNSKESVEQFVATRKIFTAETETISEISEALIFCDDFNDFILLLQEHEDVMQFVLQEEKVQSKLFADFPGAVKSLGAWGGDFVMAAAEIDATEIKNYFRNKGFETIVSYDQMVLFI